MKKSIKPVLKWVGGKRKLLKHIIPFIPDHKMYVEPFVGGAAVLLHLQPTKAVINDFNVELINLYKVIQFNPEDLVLELEQHLNKNSEDYFYYIRELDRDKTTYHRLSNIQKAARLIYLNKTCYNGVYRVNSLGQFNTPYGRYKKPRIIDVDSIMQLSKYFNSNDIKILNGNYDVIESLIDTDTFVYLDPPYMPIANSVTSFTGYTAVGFDENEQIKLRDFCVRMNERGVKFLMSNSDCEFIREIYSGFNIQSFEVIRNINNSKSSKSFEKELLIYNYSIK